MSNNKFKEELKHHPISHDIENLKASWNDTICDEFIKKIKNTDTTITSIIDQLEILRNLWQVEKVDNEQEVV